MSEADETPEWWSEVINPSLTSKADARHVIKLCRDGELRETWKPGWSTYLTSEGRIKLTDYHRAQDMLIGVANPGPGRKGYHDWDAIDRLIDEAAKNMGARPVRAEICRRVSEKYQITSTSSALRKRVSDLMKMAGR